MLVQHYCYYLTDWAGISPRQQDFDTNKVVKCLKGQPINGYAQIGIAGLSIRLEQSSKEEFLARLWTFIGKDVAKTLRETTTIVPIPNSSAVVGASPNYRTLSFASSMASASSGKLVAEDCLRWRSAAPAVHTTAGHRSPEPRYDNLVVVQKPTRPVILFDDVVTSGSSFIAAVWRLSEIGAALNKGLVVARSTCNQEPNMFKAEGRDLAIPQPPLF
ncbi:hypothetical protein BJ122_105117 [Rhodopseudomonas faecalis]|uniref:Phosphoribosyl transferase-like protein n=1 Tax=Rhodopseudomonas faecalis TaxID=99655 RepID=A0A318TJ83_9BRAD|nr:hypothetical protein [Rhodopseudomonas faecalis]PYF03860.1 hypothetical protein BJ122_105117 [Rhodopseudomonas faecalis]